MTEESIVTIAVAVIGSGIINALIAKIGARSSEIDSIKKSVESISDKLDDHIKADDERDAIQCRARIHRFNDELLHGERHTKEHFDSILLDCTRYGSYCDFHKDFSNEVTIAAEEHIRNVYKDCLANKSFL